MDNIWDAGGLVSVVLDERRKTNGGRKYTARPDQKEIARLVGTLIDRSASIYPAVALVEGGAGVGKTLGYMVPGCLSIARNGGRLLVSTHTLALMRQLVERDGQVAIEVAAKATGKRLHMAQLRGRRNFVSPSRCRALVEAMAKDHQPASICEAYEALVKRVDDANRIASELLAAPETAWGDNTWKISGELVDIGLIDSFIETGIEVPKDEICLTSIPVGQEDAIYQLNRRLADKADVLVTTQANAAISLMRRMLPGADDRDVFDLLVIDEADQWPHSAAAVTAVDVSLASVEALVHRTMATVRSNDLVRLALSPSGSEAITLIEDLRSAAPAEANAKLPLASTDATLSRLGLLRDNLAEILAATDKREYLAAVRGHYINVLRSIDQILAASKSNSGFWKVGWETSQIHAKPSITVRANAPGRMLKTVWKHDGDAAPLAKAILLTSATLSTPGFKNEAAWQGIKTAVGIQLAGGDVLQEDLCAAIHPKNYGTLRFRPAHPLAEVPSPGPKGEISVAALQYTLDVIEAARHEGGRVLVLVPSYRDVDQLAGSIAPGVLLHRTGTRLKPLLEKYSKTPDACLISPAAWVGVDLPGLVDHLVVTRLPFAPPQEGHETLPVWAIAEMLAKLNQGISRAIRDASDNATFWCADPRLPPPAVLMEREMLPAHPKSNGLYLAAIPERFRRAFEHQEANGKSPLVDFAVRLAPPAAKKKRIAR